MPRPIQYADVVDLPILERAATVAPESVDLDARTVQVTVSTGARVRRSGWFSDDWIEELGLGDDEVDLGYLNSGRAPVLDAHGGGLSGPGYSVLGQLGRVVAGSARFVDDETQPQGRRLDATLEFSGSRADVLELLADMRSGVRGTNVSVGYRVHTMRDVTEPDDELTVLRAIRWEPMEVSPVAIGADAGAHVREAAQVNRCAVVSSRHDSVARGARRGKGDGTMDWMDQVRALAREHGAAEFGERWIQERGEKQEGETALADFGLALGAELERKRRAAETTPTPAPAPASAASEVEAAIAADRQRATAIRELGARLEIEPAEIEQLAGNGTSLEAARGVFLERVCQRNAALGPVRSSTVEVTTDEWDKVRAGIANAIAVRCELRQDRGEDDPLDPIRPVVRPRVQLTESGRAFRALSLLEIAREMLRRAGRPVPDTRSGVADAIFRLRVSGAQGTSDFPEILANTAGRAMRQAYEASPRTWLAISSRNDAPDFKEQARLQLGAGSGLDLVGQSGEYTRGKLTEAAEKYSLATYGKVFPFTRQALINDDLDAFSRWPRRFGRTSAEKESDLAWAILTGNQVMGDGVTLFHANHGNTGTGALDATALSAGRTAMRKQTDQDSVAINVIPRYLIVPAALETTAEQLVTRRAMIDSTDYLSEMNPFSTLSAIAEPRLDAVSAVAFYLGASPAQIDMLEHAYLEGEGEGPTILTREGWDIDGMELKVRLDFAIAPLDWRGLYYSTGA